MSKAYGGIDRFRIVAAFLIVGIHTYPLVSISEDLNFGMIHVFARIAVPFFLMVTGYFVLSRKSIAGFLKKTALLYAGATILYLPVSLYAGSYADGNIVVAVAKNIMFDGTFYHLWYLPALMIGVLLIDALSRRFSLHTIFGFTLGLYMLGLLGDSYYGITEKIPLLKAVYDIAFHVFSYTRNGLFYAPVFLVMGAIMAKSEYQIKKQASLAAFAHGNQLSVTFHKETCAASKEQACRRT